MTGEVLEQTKELTFSARMLHLLKENRVEAMIVTILLYSTGALEKSVVYGSGVCWCSAAELRVKGTVVFLMRWRVDIIVYSILSQE